MPASRRDMVVTTVRLANIEWSVRRIADHLGVSPRSVRYILHRYGDLLSPVLELVELYSVPEPTRQGTA